MRGGILVVVVMLSRIAAGHLEEGFREEPIVDRILQERTQKVLEDENFVLSSLPVHLRFTRNSSCPNVTEEVIQYRYVNLFVTPSRKRPKSDMAMKNVDFL